MAGWDRSTPGEVPASLVAMQNNSQKQDVLIIGGGPSGCAAAAVLAEYGLRAVVFEREKFPRYHIGESMLPFNYYPLKRIGLLDKMRGSGFVHKHSVQFVSTSGKASQPFHFATRYSPEVAQTWQVLRSEFDAMLMDNARAKARMCGRRPRCSA